VTPCDGVQVAREGCVKTAHLRHTWVQIAQCLDRRKIRRGRCDSVKGSNVRKSATMESSIRHESMYFYHFGKLAWRRAVAEMTANVRLDDSLLIVSTDSGRSSAPSNSRLCLRQQRRPASQ
jgi:hypothetical protein